MLCNSQASLLAGAAAILSTTCLLAAAQPPPQFEAPYFSRPDLNPPSFSWAIFEPALVTPGYILLTPYTAPPDSSLSTGPETIPTALTALLTSQSGGCSLAVLEAILSIEIQNGPYIYDEKGNLVYSGFGSTGGQLAHDLKVAEYKGQSVLTYYQGNDRQGGNRGHGVVMDQQYNTIASFQSGLGRAPADVHEFTVLPGGTVLMTIFQPTPYDLTAFGVNQPIGWVIEGVFQEIDITTGQVIFEWRSLDHVPLTETYNSLGSNPDAGYGNTTGLAWDYFHINSIDKDAYGNYIISSRYCSTVFNISGEDGSIIWRLGGKSSSFSLANFPTSSPFSFQHMPRILSQSDTTTVLTIFDNNSDGYNTTSNSSAGVIISLDTSSFTATLLNTYTNEPHTTTLTTSQGSMQVLDNSNVFIGWGSVPQVSEFTESGTIVALGSFGVVNEASSYRALKVPTDAWIGTPDSTPAIFTYANSTSQPTWFYVSWNGATEVANWRFYGGNGTNLNNTAVVGSAARSGFETSFMSGGFYAFGFAQALDGNGTVLGTSPTVRTFVPYSAPSNSTLPPGGGTVRTNSTLGTVNGTVLKSSASRMRKTWLIEATVVYYLLHGV